MGKLAASILSADLAYLADQVKLVHEHAEVIHIDIMDGHFVPPIALGTVVVASLRPHTDRTMHGHLMVDAPESYFEELAEAGLDVVSFHHEAVAEPVTSIDKARSAGLRAGVTLNLETPVGEVFPYLDHVDDVMLMSIKPGWSGQVLDPEVYPRLEAVRAEIDRRGLEVDVEVDGGVKIDNARRAVEAGATVLISASGIFQASDPAENARVLRAIANGEAA
ncbi:MAG: ribulose-phosphate 3-epimerase [Actinomycetota bacterium]|nr:ribulose-phosphate 3-epimerase [Actinomycetota bacterium]MDH5223994.1 ribulose-phosphate 3-epimerase [Actinomycetota bacterium]MDH5314075.1 ribulose-phosphate 3-epimerase [Actinomycetota bacterium]